MSARSVVISIVLFLAAFLSCAASEEKTGEVNQEPAAVPRVGPAPPSSIWVVVNLFGGSTSRQAVRVRDTLQTLGAEGEGIVLPYKDITVENMVKLRPAFLAMSPNGTPWCRYTGQNGVNLQNFFKALRVIIEDMQIPVMGVCGGHQALALAFGGKVGPIRGGENDCFPYVGGRQKATEKGRQNVYVQKHDPLFLGMGQVLNLVQNHFDEVKRLPEGFVSLASNPMCPHQIIRHPSRPAYGIQAHTEYYFQGKPDGGLLLRNFLHIARTHNRISRAAQPESRQTTAVDTAPSQSSRPTGEKVIYGAGTNPPMR